MIGIPTKPFYWQLGYEQVSTEYYIHVRTKQRRSGTYRHVSGKPISIPEFHDLDLFWREDEQGKAVVSEALTGMSLCKCSVMQVGQVSNLSAEILANESEHDKKVRLLIVESLAMGVSPRYQKLEVKR